MMSASRASSAGRDRAGRWALALILLARIPAAAFSETSEPFDPREFEEAVAEFVFEELRAARLESGLGETPRLDALDRSALRRAEAVAAEPPDRRLRPNRPLEDFLDPEPDLADRRVGELVELQVDVGDPVPAVMEAWRAHAPAWELVADERVEALGVASTLAGDGTRVIVALFLEAPFANTDLHALERRVEAEINRIRREHGLRALTPQDPLRRVARRHSADMAERRYFNHYSPENLDFKDRVEAERIPFRSVAENIGKTVAMDDPVPVVVDGWMHSEGHRENLLHPRFRRTGVGIAVDDRGVYYFTQLFIEPQPTGFMNNP